MVSLTRPFAEVKLNLITRWGDIGEFDAAVGGRQLCAIAVGGWGWLEQPDVRVADQRLGPATPPQPRFSCTYSGRITTVLTSTNPDPIPSFLRA